MIVPMRKGMLPWWDAAISRIGVPIIAPTSPIPWLIPFATSSPADWVQFPKGSDLLIAFIARDHATHIERILPNKNVGVRVPCWMLTLSACRPVALGRQVVR